MNRCLLFFLLRLIFSFVPLFPIPTISSNSYQIYFKLETVQNGSKVLPAPANGVAADCKVGRAVLYARPTSDEIRQKGMTKALNDAIRVRPKLNLTEWQKFRLGEDGAAHRLTVDKDTLTNVPVVNLAVECEFQGHLSTKNPDALYIIKIKVFDVEGNPRFGGTDEVSEPWDVSTWVLKPVQPDVGVNAFHYTWFVKHGRPEDDKGKVYRAASWKKKSGVSWPSGRMLSTGTEECHPPHIWERMINGQYKKTRNRDRGKRRTTREENAESREESGEHKPKKPKTTKPRK